LRAHSNRALNRAPYKSLRIHRPGFKLNLRTTLPRVLVIQRPPLKEISMLHYAIVFLVIALIAGVLGFAGIAGAPAGIAKILFLIFLVLFVVSLVMGRRKI
jgi:uncharacterized membrane protein YtjA (UPF0391 family)